MILTNGAEGGTNGATVTKANSGGDSGQPWDNIAINGSGSLTYSSAQVMSGSLSYYVSTTASPGQAFMVWTSQITQPGKTMYMAVHCYITSRVSTTRFIQFTNVSINNCGGVGLSASGTSFTLQDSTSTIVATSTTTVPVNQWIRLEMMVFSDATAGQIELKIFLDPTSAVPTEIITTSASQNTRGDDIAAAVFGNLSNTANFGMYLDNIAVQDTAYVGLNPYISNFRQNSAEGQPNGTTLTRANSGGGSGTPFDIAFLNGGAAVTFSTAQSMHGSQSYLASCPNSTDWFVLSFSNGVNDTSGAYRFYIYLNAFSSAACDIAFPRAATGSVAKVQIGTTGVLAVCDTTGSLIKSFSTSPLTTGVWYRIEQQCVVGTTTTNGTITTQYFLGDSLVPIDSYSASNVNTGTSPIIDFRVGKLTISQGTINAYFDDIACVNGNNFLIGPSSVNATTSWVNEQVVPPIILTGSGYSTSSTSTNATSIALNKPGSLADGDYLMVCIAHQLTGGVLNVPSGWSTLTTSTSGGSQGIYYKYISSAAAETATNYTWTIGVAGRYVADLVIVRGANIGTFADVVGSWSYGSSTSIVDNSVSTLSANTTLVAFNVNYLTTTTVATITAPNGFTQSTQQNSPTTANTTDSQIAYMNLPATTVTGNQTFTFSTTTAARAGIMFAIKALSISN